jgi:putative transcriptional regulator
MQSLKHQFLISMPNMVESSFAHTITYLCDHDENGAMGLIINRPTDIPLDTIFNQLNIDDNTRAHARQPIYSGGPVQTDRGFILHPNDKQWDATVNIAGNISLTTSNDIITAIARNEGPEDCLVALGYAGWSAGQLEEELAGNSWLVVPADEDIIFNTPYHERLNAAVAQLGISLEQLSPHAGRS